MFGFVIRLFQEFPYFIFIFGMKIGKRKINYGLNLLAFPIQRGFGFVFVFGERKKDKAEKIHPYPTHQ